MTAEEPEQAPVQATTDKDATADELAAPPEAVNMTDEEEMGAASNKDNSDSGKLKALLNVLKRMVGVKDLAAIRLSLPANLLEPVPNLEYWNYLDRGDLFTVIADLPDPLDRMLAVLRFTLTKELKFVHGKICKPYNSILGEHFRCHWDVHSPEITETGELIPKMALLTSNPTPMRLAGSTAIATSESKTKKKKSDSTQSASVSEDKGGNTNSNTTAPAVEQETSKVKRGLSKMLLSSRSNSKANTSSSNSSMTQPKSPAPSTSASSKTTEEAGADAEDDASIAGSFKTTKSGAEVTARRIAFLTEQVSHHPPISSFYVACKEAGVELYGVDQLSAKFTGTSIRIFPGEYNQGIFARLTKDAKCGAEGEEYQITHPTASLNGLLRGSLWVAICDSLYITCRGGKRGEEDNGKRLRSVVEYKDESWVMKAKYALEGVIYEYDADKEDEHEKIKNVPSDRIVATFEGTWKGQITWKKKGDKDSHLLIDLEQLDIISPKSVRPLDKQEEMESRKIWKPVTEAIVNKEFGQATKHKQEIEQKQRETAAERKRRGEEFTPRFFNEDISNGRPTLTTAGRKALDDELERSGPDDEETPKASHK